MANAIDEKKTSLRTIRARSDGRQNLDRPISAVLYNNLINMRVQHKTKATNTLSNRHYIYIGLFILLLQAILHLSVEASIAKQPKNGIRKAVGTAHKRL